MKVIHNNSIWISYYHFFLINNVWWLTDPYLGRLSRLLFANFLLIRQKTNIKSFTYKIKIRFADLVNVIIYLHTV